MKTEDGKWCYSFNEENFEETFETKEEAIEEALWHYKDDELDQDFIWVGQTKAIKLGVDIYHVIEGLQETAHWQAGEAAEGFLDNIKPSDMKELEESLNKALFAWMDKFKHNPRFYTVENIEKIEVEKYLNA